MEREEKQMIQEGKHTAYSWSPSIQGYSEEVLVAATAAGAAGGTVGHARRAWFSRNLKKWGNQYPARKEIVYILGRARQKMAIMKAISKQCGLQSDAQGILISIPVDSVIGLNSDPAL